MRQCQTCGAIILFGGITHEKGYCCSQECLDGAAGLTFCQECLTQTLPVSSGSLNRFNGCGFAFVGKANRCNRCHSVTTRIWYTLLGIPILPLGKYRVLYIQRYRMLRNGQASHFYSRLLRSSQVWGTSEREMKLIDRTIRVVLLGTVVFAVIVDLLIINLH